MITRQPGPFAWSMPIGAHQNLHRAARNRMDCLAQELLLSSSFAG